MTNLELIAKLNSLKKIKPDQNWLDSNRELLLSQISNSGAESLSFGKSLLINLSSLSKAAAQPVYALGAFVLLLLGSSLLSQQFLAQAKPNDSLYIARIIAENVKLGTTFNTVDRDRLAAQFAIGHAQDINTILANPAFNTPANSAQVAKLSNSFNQEVQTAKNQINSLTNVDSSQPAAALSPITPVNPVVAVKTANSGTAAVKSGNTNGDFIMADSFKDKQGISLAETENKNNSGDNLSGKLSDATSAPALKDNSHEATPGATTTLTATSTNLKATSTLEVSNPAADANKILDEAQKLLDSKDYGRAADKLKEVENIINN